MSIFSNVAANLAAFDIRTVVDSNGKPVEIVPEFTDGTISHPAPFKCSIKPRSAHAEHLIFAD